MLCKPAVYGVKREGNLEGKEGGGGVRGGASERGREGVTSE